MSAGFSGPQQQQHHSQSGGGGSGWGGHSGSGSGAGGGGGSFNPLAQLSHVPGMSGVSSTLNKFSSFVPGGLGGFGGSSHGGGGRRGLDDDNDDLQSSTRPAYQDQGQGQGQSYGQPGLLQPEMAPGAGQSVSRAHSPAPPTGYEAYHSSGGVGAGQGEYRPEAATYEARYAYGYGPPPPGQGPEGGFAQQQQQQAGGAGGGSAWAYPDQGPYQSGQSAQYYDDAAQGQGHGQGQGNIGRDHEYYR